MKMAFQSNLVRGRAKERLKREGWMEDLSSDLGLLWVDWGILRSIYYYKKEIKAEVMYN